MRFYLRSIAELAIEAFVQARLLVTGRPDADALAAAGNPDTCPDEIPAPEWATDERAIRLVRVQMGADIRHMTGLAQHHLAEWDRELSHMEDS